MICADEEIFKCQVSLMVKIAFFSHKFAINQMSMVLKLFPVTFKIKAPSKNRYYLRRRRKFLV